MTSPESKREAIKQAISDGVKEAYNRGYEQACSDILSMLDVPLPLSKEALRIAIDSLRNSLRLIDGMR